MGGKEGGGRKDGEQGGGKDGNKIEEARKKIKYLI